MAVIVNGKSVSYIQGQSAVAWISGSTTSTSGNLLMYVGTSGKVAADSGILATSRAPNPFHDYEVVMAQRWTVYTPKSMGGTDAEFITEVLATSGIERTYLGYTNGITQHAYLEIEMPDDWDGGNVDFRFNWETTSASANTCIMQLWGLRTATGGTSDAALTQLASVTSTNAGAGLRNVSSFSSDFTISGSGNHLSLMFTRSTGDTLAAAVKILSVTLKYIRTVA